MDIRKVKKLIEMLEESSLAEIEIREGEEAIRSHSSVSSPRAPSEPGTQGTPAAFMASLAETLSPIKRMVSGRGPMKVKPDCSTRSAKSAFADRKP